MLYGLKTTRSAPLAALAAELHAACEARKELEKREGALKDALRQVFPKGGTVKAGDYQITVARKSRRSLPRATVVALLGEAAVRASEVVTPYLEVTVAEAPPAQLHS